MLRELVSSAAGADIQTMCDWQATQMTTCALHGQVLGRILVEKGGMM